MTLHNSPKQRLWDLQNDKYPAFKSAFGCFNEQTDWKSDMVNWWLVSWAGWHFTVGGLAACNQLIFRGDGRDSRVLMVGFLSRLTLYCRCIGSMQPVNIQGGDGRGSRALMVGFLSRLTFLLYVYRQHATSEYPGGGMGQ